MLRLQFVLNLFPFSFFILEEDPGDTKIDESKKHGNIINISLDRSIS